MAFLLKCLHKVTFRYVFFLMRLCDVNLSSAFSFALIFSFHVKNTDFVRVNHANFDRFLPSCGDSTRLLKLVVIRCFTWFNQVYCFDSYLLDSTSPLVRRAYVSISSCNVNKAFKIEKNLKSLPKLKLLFHSFFKGVVGFNGTRSTFIISIGSYLLLFTSFVTFRHDKRC